MTNNIKEDRYWKIDEILPHVMKWLTEKFPNAILEREFDDVDIMVHGPKIPVEIQKTPECKTNCGKPHISGFEKLIEKRIRIDIENCGMCWFLLDTRFLNQLQNNSLSRSQIDMSWFYQFWKDGKLKVFTIDLNKNIKEILEDKEFDFIKEKKERRILGKEKYEIAYKIYNRYGFTTEEINRWYNEYRMDNNRTTKGLIAYLSKKGGRERVFANIRLALCNLDAINDMLICNLEPSNRAAIGEVRILGIINSDRNNGKNSKIICTNEDNILEHFSGYFENKELWNYWMTHYVDYNTFFKVVTGEYPNYLEDRKKQKTIEDSWS